MPKSDIGQQVRAIYQERPYPSRGQLSIRRSGRQLPPFEWIRAICRMRERSPNRILVAGCGTGAEAFALKKRFSNSDIVGVDFSSKSIDEANALQRQVKAMSSIRFLTADLTDPNFRRVVGGKFDFISCHGVLSYIPWPAQALRNIWRCLSESGALYLGVNSSAHYSVRGRSALRGLGWDVQKLPPEREIRRILRVCDALGAEADVPKAKLPLNYLAGDLFGPLIHNFSLCRWIRLCDDAGLSFIGHYYAFKKLRAAINKGLLDILRPLNRREIYTLIDRLDPCGFHQMTFAKRPPVTPKWVKKDMLDLRPVLTSLYRIAPKKRGKFLRLQSASINTLVEIDSAKWEREFLRRSTGKHTVAEILRELPERVPWRSLCKRLYLFYHLAVINFERA